MTLLTQDQIRKGYIAHGPAWLARQCANATEEAVRLQERVKALESSGASAFNAWRTSSDVIGAMHVLREVVGAEFVDAQRKLKKP